MAMGSYWKVSVTNNGWKTWSIFISGEALKDLRSQVAAYSSCNILTSDIKYLLLDKSRAKVWSAGYLSFALWYAPLWVLIQHCNVRLGILSFDWMFNDEIIYRYSNMHFCNFLISMHLPCLYITYTRLNILNWVFTISLYYL